MKNTTSSNDKEVFTVIADIDKLLSWAASVGVSDIHLTVGRPPCVRIHGQLLPITELDNIRESWSFNLTPNDTRNYAEVIINEMHNERIIEKPRVDSIGQNGSIDIAYSIPGVSRFRCSIYQQRNTVSIALRPISTTIPSLDDLNISRQRVIEKLIMRKNGLVLVTGPTGSGKSTTLAAMINHINKHKHSNIITLEDPIEFIHNHINSTVSQIEVGIDTPSFANGLRSVLRQDPDVILIGEMRDLETVSIALTAAETGHLVLATLHTRDATQTIDRIIDVFPTNQQSQIRTQLAGSLQGVISQQLIPRADNEGRALAQEILLTNTAIQNHIREGKTHQIASVIQMSRKEGMQLMGYAMQELVENGVINQGEVAGYGNSNYK